MRPKPDASKFYKQNQRTDRNKITEAQKAIREKLGLGENRIEARKKNPQSVTRG